MTAYKTNTADFNDLLGASVFSSLLETSVEQDNYNMQESQRKYQNVLTTDKYRQSLANINSMFIGKSTDLLRVESAKNLKIASQKETALAIAAANNTNPVSVLQAAKVHADQVHRDTVYTRQRLANDIFEGKQDVYMQQRQHYRQATQPAPNKYNNVLGGLLNTYSTGITQGLVENPLNFFKGGLL